jgi:transcriptional regulator with XRE-family HTH domain
MERFQISLAAARVNAKLTQKQAAEKLNVSNKTLNNWEAGRSMPKADAVAKMCEVYGVSYDNLNFLPSDSL